MAQSQDEEWLNRAATELSPLERQVLVLSARDRLSNAEIGAQLDIAPGRVERTLARAVARFDGVLAVEADRRAGLRRRCLRDWLRAIWRIVRRWRSP